MQFHVRCLPLTQDGARIVRYSSNKRFVESYFNVSALSLALVKGVHTKKRSAGLRGIILYIHSPCVFGRK